MLSMRWQVVKQVDDFKISRGSVDEEMGDGSSKGRGKENVENVEEEEL